MSQRRAPTSRTVKKSRPQQPDDPPQLAEIRALLNSSRRLMWSDASKVLEARGESVLAWQAVWHLKQFGPMQQSDLARSTTQHHAGLSRLLTDLEKRGLIKRIRDAVDRRRVMVSLAKAGRRWFARRQKEVSRAASEPLRVLTETEQLDLLRLLRKITSAR